MIKKVLDGQFSSSISFWNENRIYKSGGGIHMKYVFPEYKENVGKRKILLRCP